MTEKDLLYYYPYRIDKKLNLRQYVNDRNGFIRKYIPFYDGTNTHEFIKNRTDLTKLEEYNFNYDYSEYIKFCEWSKYGRNIFSFSRELLILLDKTDVNEITPDKFHLPYDIFYLSLKPLGLRVANDMDKIIEGVYVDHNIWNYKGEHPDGYCELGLRFVGDFKCLYHRYADKVTSRLSYRIDENEHFDKYPLGDFWNIWLMFDITEGRENVEQAIYHFLEGIREEIFPRKDSNQDVTDHELDFYSSTVHLLNRTIKIVINCFLYLSQPVEKVDIETVLPEGLPHNFNRKSVSARTKKEKEKTHQKINESGFSKINYIGGTFKYGAVKGTEAGHSVEPHWRRGHWRNQKFGHGLEEEKLLWIKPTIVNSVKGTPKKGHLYEVKKAQN